MRAIDSRATFAPSVPRECAVFVAECVLNGNDGFFVSFSQKKLGRRKSHPVQKFIDLSILIR